MSEIIVARANKSDLPQAIALWGSIFSQDWGEREVDISSLRRTLSLLLSLRRLPARTLQHLGAAAELWVAREGEEVVGVMGQLGERIPCFTGLVFDPRVRSFRAVRFFVQQVCSELANAGFQFARSLPKAESGVIKLAIRLGWTALGDVRSYLLPLPNQALPMPNEDITVRVLGWRERAELERTAIAQENLGLALTLEGAYGVRFLRLIGLKELFLVAEEGGKALGYMGIALDPFQPQGPIHIPYLAEAEAYPFLLAKALDIISHAGKVLADITIWEKQTAGTQFIEELGGQRGPDWTWIVREL